MKFKNLPDHFFKYQRLVKVYSGNKVLGEIEMETSCAVKAKARLYEQRLEVWQYKQFSSPQRFVLNKQEKILYRYLQKNTVDCYTPISKDIRELAENYGKTRNVCQRAIRALKEGGVISAHQKRGSKPGLYIKL